MDTYFVSLAQKIAWLRENPRYWVGIDWYRLEQHEYKRKRRELVDAMKAAGLYSRTTATGDVDIMKLMEHALITSA